MNLRKNLDTTGESVRRRNSLESVALFSLKQEAPASIGGSTFTRRVKVSAIMYERAVAL